MEVFYVEEQNVKAHRPCICFKVLGVAGKMLNEVLNLAKSHSFSRRNHVNLHRGLCEDICSTKG